MNLAWSSGRQRSAAASSYEPAAAGRGYPDRDQHSRSDYDHARGIYPLYFLANIASRAAMLIVLIVLTRLLPTTEYGLFALVVTVGEILEMGSSNWVRVYLLRTEAGAGKMRPRQLGRALVLSASGTAAALVASMVVAPFISADRMGEMILAVAVYTALSRCCGRRSRWRSFRAVTSLTPPSKPDGRCVSSQQRSSRPSYIPILSFQHRWRFRLRLGRARHSDSWRLSGCGFGSCFRAAAILRR